MHTGERALVRNFKPAERLKNVKLSGIRRFFAIAQKTPDCVNLSVGEPDFSPPARVLKAGYKAAESGKTHYEPTNGIFELREALAAKASREYGLSYDPDSEIIVTVGGTEAIFAGLFGLVNPGDEVLVPNPGFVVYEPCVKLAEGKPVPVALYERDGFRMGSENVMSLITDKSRVIILNYPNNPTGSILSHDEMAELAKIAVERDLIVISDEVYEKVIYDGNRHFSPASFPGMRERTLIVNSFSKTYAMTGLRVGFVYGPKELISALWLIHQYAVACVDSISQYAALEALTGPQDFVQEMVKEFDRRRHQVYDRLSEIEGFRCALPKGAFYLFPNVEGFKLSSERFADFLAEKAHVATVPGSSFGSMGEGHVRISYAASYHDLERALDRIEKSVASLK
jgi:aminotransferase